MKAKQADLICSQCPLADCDEKSLWCLYRLSTDPNSLQRKVLLPTIKRVISRQDYFAAYYAINRERKLKAANERNRQKALERQAG